MGTEREEKRDNIDAGMMSQNQERGRYLYSDYTPLEENKNILGMIKDFVSVSSKITKIHKDLEALSSMLGQAEQLHGETIAKINQFKVSCRDTIDAFHKKHGKTIETMYLQQLQEGSDLLLSTERSLDKTLAEAEQGFTENNGRYRMYIQSKTTDSKNNAVNTLGSWLVGDYYDLPYTLTSKINSIVNVSIDDVDGRNYKIFRTNSLMQAINNRAIAENNNSSAASGDAVPPEQPPSAVPSGNHTSTLSYSFLVNNSELEFWDHKRKIEELGIKDIQIPIGFKIPFSEKIKKPFRSVPGMDRKDRVEREPAFANADNYYILAAKLDNNADTLLAVLADDLSRPDENLIHLNYRLSDLYELHAQDKDSRQRGLPKIDYIPKDHGSPDVKVSGLLEIKEIAESTDISKIMLLGRALLDKMRTLQNPSVVASRSKLKEIKVGDADALSNSNVPSPPCYDPDLVSAFLKSIAKGFAPLIQKLKEKSSVKGEMIIRYEIEGGGRKEYMVRIEDLNSQLSATDDGRKISSLLGLYAGGSDTNTTAA